MALLQGRCPYCRMFRVTPNATAPHRGCPPSPVLAPVLAPPRQSTDRYREEHRSGGP